MVSYSFSSSDVMSMVLVIAIGVVLVLCQAWLSLCGYSVLTWSCSVASSQGLVGVLLATVGLGVLMSFLLYGSSHTFVSATTSASSVLSQVIIAMVVVLSITACCLIPSASSLVSTSGFSLSSQCLVLLLTGLYGLLLVSRLFGEVDLSVGHVGYSASGVLTGLVVAILGSCYGYMGMMAAISVLCLLLPWIVTWSYTAYCGYLSMDSSAYGLSGLGEYSCGLVRNTKNIGYWYGSMDAWSTWCYWFLMVDALAVLLLYVLVGVSGSVLALALPALVCITAMYGVGGSIFGSS